MLSVPKAASTERRFSEKLRRRSGMSFDLKSSPPVRQPLVNPKTVERVAQARLPTEFGEFRIIGYRSLTSKEEFVVLAQGELNIDRPILVRIHSQCMTGDVFGSVKCDCGQQLRAAMEKIAREGRGVIIYQQQEGRGIGIINKIRAYALQDQGAEILLDLGLCEVRVMSNNPAKIRALEQSGVRVVARIALEVPPTAAAFRYLRTKKEKMGHLLEA